MSDQHEQDHQDADVVPVEVYHEDQPTEEHDAVEADPQPDAVDEDHVDDHDVDGGEAASDSSDPAVPVERANANDLRDEQYERAKVDPEFAVQQAIPVPEEDRGPAWQYGSLAEHERTEALRAQADADEDDSDGEV